MDYRTFCNNKGCYKEMRPVVKKETLEAFCTECGKVVDNISIFMIRQMVANGQVQRTDKKKLAWSVKCQKCQKEGPPELGKDDNTLVCTFCKEEHVHLNKPFAQTIKTNLKAQKRSGENT